MSPDYNNPHVDAVADLEKCRFCAEVMPDDWDAHDWHEVTRKSDDETFYCCDVCYWAEVYDGPLQGDGEPFGPTTEQQMATLALKR